MAGKAINEYNTFSGNASAVNVLVQEKSQTDPNTYEHKKASLDTLVNTMKGIPSGLASLDEEGKIPNSQMPDLSAYATKAELNADVATLQSQIDRNKAEIENLKQTTKQDEQTVAYPNDGTYSSIMPNGVPASVAKYGEVANIRGKTRGWNRLIKSSDLVTGTTYDVIFSVTADGELQLSGTCSGDTQIQIVSNDVDACVAGHKYLLIGGTANFMIRPYDSADWDAGSGTIFTAQSSNSLRLAGMLVNGTVYNQKTHVFVRDLTTIFPEGVPATVADCVKACPDILKYDAYGYSLVNTTVTGVVSDPAGKNFMDISQYGEVELITGVTRYGLKRKLPAGTYTISGNCGSYNYTVGTIIGNTIVDSYNVTGAFSQTLTLSSDGYIAIWSTDSGDYLSLVMLNSGSSALPWEAYRTDTLSLSQSVTLKSAGSVSEVLDVQTGKKTRPIGSVDLGTLNWIWTGDGLNRFYADFQLAKPAIDNDTPVNYTCAMYKTVSNQMFDDNYISLDMVVRGGGVGNVGAVWIRDLSCNGDASALTAKLNGLYLNYELATPLSDEQVCDPIIDNYIEVQAGGTINTIQSQTPVIDNCLDVTYDFIPA